MTARDAAERITPCCHYKWEAPDSGPIFWNQYNNVVQCHYCGTAFDQRALTAPPEDREAQLDNLATFICSFTDSNPGWSPEDLADAILRSGFRRGKVDAALRVILDRYVALAGSGDCGFWNPEEEDCVKQARAALADLDGKVGG
jgi:hypothetical protein